RGIAPSAMAIGNWWPAEPRANGSSTTWGTTDQSSTTSPPSSRPRRLRWSPPGRRGPNERAFCRSPLISPSPIQTAPLPKRRVNSAAGSAKVENPALGRQRDRGPYQSIAGHHKLPVGCDIEPKLFPVGRGEQVFDF